MIDNQLNELIEYTKETWGLVPYYIGRHHIYRKLTADFQTIYILNMEWFPSTYADWVNKEENPEGTASIDINFHSKEFLNAIFVEGKTYAENGVVFPNKERNEVEQWLSTITGYKLDEFVLKKQASNSLYYEREVNGISFSPLAYLDVEWDEQGRLTSFTKENIEGENAIIIEETFSLSVLEIEELITKQVILATFPTEVDSKLVYGIEEVFVRNDKKGTLPFSFEYEFNRKKVINQTIVWIHSKKDTFVRKPIPFAEEVTIEQAHSKEPHPDILPITLEETECCINEITSFLQMKYPNDSGKWMIKSIYRERSTFHAELEEVIPDRFPKNKLLIILDEQTSEVLNYMEKGVLWKKIFKKDSWNTKEVKVSKTEVYKTLKKYISLTPYFVLDSIEKKYVLCGKLDCSYYVDAETGLLLDSDLLTIY